MKKYFFVFLLSIITVSQLLAQVTLSRQVLGTIGGSADLSGQTNVSYTGGETVVKTISNDNSLLTQGFHQPGAVLPLTYDLEVTPTSCLNANDGMARVQNIFGCFQPYTITWSNGELGPVVYDLPPGMYSVTVSTALCVLTKEFEIIRGSDQECELKFLNAFSPNNDGINDNWVIKNINKEEFQDNKVEIYNRWGQMIWSAKNYDNHDVVWDGHSDDGVQLISGTYFYMATVNEKLYKGYIEITR